MHGHAQINALENEFWWYLATICILSFTVSHGRRHDFGSELKQICDNNDKIDKGANSKPYSNVSPKNEEFNLLSYKTVNILDGHYVNLL